MKKSFIAKTTLCCGVAVAIIATTNIPRFSAAAIDSEAGIAGISITLDKYCASGDNTQQVSNESVPSVSTATQTAVVTTDAAVSTQAAVTTNSKYANTAISIATEYVNIRKKASTDSKVIGKLYRGAAATVLDNQGEWIKVKSGSCTGYVSSMFLAVGDKAEKYADEFGTKLATVNTTTLKVRDKKSTDADCLTLIPIGETYQVLKEDSDWVKISIDDGDVKGYVSKDFVDIDMEFEHAISIKEEKEKLRKEEEERKRAEQERLEREQAQAAQNAASSTTPPATSTTTGNSSGSNTTTKKSYNRSSSSNRSSSVNKNSSTKKNTTTSNKNQSSGTTVSGSGTGSQVAQYALQFVGNPYVWGGSSLTNGADCSGFTMAVYRHFGVSLPHSSGAQSGMGRSVSLSQAQAGDLVFYGSPVSHVALYIGNGRVVHASTKKTGIKTSSVGYRSITCIRRILN